MEGLDCRFPTGPNRVVLGIKCPQKNTVFVEAYDSGMKLHPDPATQSVTVRQAIGHFPMGAQGNHFRN